LKRQGKGKRLEIVFEEIEEPHHPSAEYEYLKKRPRNDDPSGNSPFMYASRRSYWKNDATDVSNMVDGS
jgi:hypothetical protein